MWYNISSKIVMSKFPKALDKNSVNILKTEMFPLITSLGDADVEKGEALPGTAPIFKNDVDQEKKEFARGTTWDFGGVVFDGEEIKKMAGNNNICCITSHYIVSNIIYNVDASCIRV